MQLVGFLVWQKVCIRGYLIFYVMVSIAISTKRFQVQGS